MLRNPSLNNFDWDTLCGTGSYKTDRSKAEKQIAELEYRLIHNLFKDNFTAKITLGDGEQGEVFIYSIDGRQMGRHLVSGGTNSLDLNADKLSAGVFLYKVLVNGVTKNNGKLVVVH